MMTHLLQYAILQHILSSWYETVNLTVHACQDTTREARCVAPNLHKPKGYGGVGVGMGGGGGLLAKLCTTE